MKILEYSDLDISGLEMKYDKVKNFIEKGDYYSAQVKKLKGSTYYAARLDHINRLLFDIVSYEGKLYSLILEVIRNHDYANSRFLNGAKIIEDNIVVNAEEIQKHKINYLNDTQRKFYFLNKPISFDQQQATIYLQETPLIIIGSAGSGKTMLSLEKMKNFTGRVLYVSLASYLVNNSRNLYYSHYQNERQEVDFYSFHEFIEAIKIPTTTEFNASDFKSWFKKYQNNYKIKDVNKIYEELKGTITGNDPTKPFLSWTDYSALGIKQALFANAEREVVYGIFNKYLAYLKEKGFHDLNILAYEYLHFVQPQYDYILIDEVQDLTKVQIKLLIESLYCKDNFILCGDSNQIAAA